MLSPDEIRRRKPVCPYLVPAEQPEWIPEEYRTEHFPLQPGEKITGWLGFPAAQLLDPPAEIAEEISVWKLPPEEPDLESSPAFAVQMISSTRYRGSGHITYVTTAFAIPPSDNPIIWAYGAPITLADGTLANVVVVGKPTGRTIEYEGDPGFEYDEYEWPDVGMPYCKQQDSQSLMQHIPHQMAFLKDGLIVSIASSLPLQKVIELAESIVLA